MSSIAPVISSITANYNNSKYLTQCLDGLISQSTTINNIIVVDDKSTDDSWDVLNKFTMLCTYKDGFILHKKTDDYIKFTSLKNQFIFIKNEINRGPAFSRNVGVKECLENTDVICICDSDDFYYKDKVKKSVEILRDSSKNIGLVYSDYDILNMKDMSLFREYKEIFTYKRLYEECIVSNNSIVDASVFNKIGLYDESLYGPEDYDLWLRISEKFPVYHIAESLYTYRLTGNNLTVATDRERLIDHLRKVHMKKQQRMTNESA